MEHALCLGASGMVGWGIVNQILTNYPAKGTYSRVTALTRRPISREEALWPVPDYSQPELNIVTGIDLTKGTVDDKTETLRVRIPDIGSVTHVFYCAYQSDPDRPHECAINLAMMRRALGAIELLAPKLKYIIMPSSHMAYGIHLGKSLAFVAPFTEDMVLAEPWRSEVHAYQLRDELQRMQQGKKWRWAELRIGLLWGFQPLSNVYNNFALLTNFLSLYKYMNEEGHPDAELSSVPFPFAASVYKKRLNCVTQDVCARFAIHLCLSSASSASGQCYNIASSSTPHSMESIWPALCRLFGLEGRPPAPLGSTTPESRRTLVQFVRDHPIEVQRMATEKGVSLQKVYLEYPLGRYVSWFDFDHHVELGKARSVGFMEERAYEFEMELVLGRQIKARRAYRGTTATATGRV